MRNEQRILLSQLQFHLCQLVARMYFFFSTAELKAGRHVQEHDGENAVRELTGAVNIVFNRKT